MMRPLQIYLDDTDMTRLEEWARTHRWTKSEAVRVALRAVTRPRETDPLLAASGMIEALPEDLSEQVDRYLEETFIAEKKPGYSRTRRF
jgi:Arc/MetJ family transcription regulator